MVSISELDKRILIKIVLEKESMGDMEEIDDLTSEFEALQACAVDFEIKVEVSNSELFWPDKSTIVVYRRKEI